MATTNHSVAALVVTGGSNTSVGETVRGSYCQEGEHHGRPLFKKLVSRAVGSGTSQGKVLIYYWDDRKDQSMRGWWIGPELGGDQVWSFNANAALKMPPGIGWRIPWDGPVDATLRLRVGPGGGGGAASSNPPAVSGEVPSSTSAGGTTKRPRSPDEVRGTRPQDKDRRKKSSDEGRARRPRDEDRGRRLPDEDRGRRRLDEERGRRPAVEDRARRQADEERCRRLPMEEEQVKRRREQEDEIRRETQRREMGASMAVRRVLSQLHTVSFKDFEALSAEVKSVLIQQREMLGGCREELEREASDMLSQTRWRLERTSALVVREVVRRIGAAVTSEDLDALKAELSAVQADAWEKMGSQADEVARDACEAVRLAEHRLEQTAAMPIMKAIRRLASVTPETFEALRAELEEVQSEQLGKLGSQKERVLQDSAAALQQAEHEVRQCVERRAEELRLRLEEERRASEEAERIDKLTRRAQEEVGRLEREAQRVAEVTRALSVGKGGRPLPIEDAMQAAEAVEEARAAAAAEAEAASGSLAPEVAALLDAQPSVPTSSSSLAVTPAASSSACGSAQRVELCTVQERLAAVSKALAGFAEPTKRALETASRRAAAARREQIQQAIFARYDVDGDKRLAHQEVVELARVEYDLNVSERVLGKIGRSLFEDGAGVPFGRFAHLRRVLGIERSELRARARRAAEAERKRRELEDAERRKREIAERKHTSLGLVDDVAELLGDAETELVRAAQAAGPLLSDERLGSASLRECSDATDVHLGPAGISLGDAETKLNEAEKTIGHDLGSFLKSEVVRLHSRLRREKDRDERLRVAVRAARERADKKAREEERAQKQRKAFARLERAYEELDDTGDSS